MRSRFSCQGYWLVDVFVLLAIVIVLASMGVSRPTADPETTRRGVCLSNLTCIDKAVAVWECQRTRLTTTSRITLTFNGKGDLTATSGRLPAGLNVKAATPPRLDDNNRAIAWFVRDDDVFFCPEYALQQGGWKVAPRTTNQYLWLSDPTPQPALSGEKRGACCLTYGSDNGTNLTKGPDGTTETAHR